MSDKTHPRCPVTGCEKRSASREPVRITMKNPIAGGPDVPLRLHLCAEHRESVVGPLVNKLSIDEQEPR